GGASGGATAGGGRTPARTASVRAGSGALEDTGAGLIGRIGVVGASGAAGATAGTVWAFERRQSQSRPSTESSTRISRPPPSSTRLLCKKEGRSSSERALKSTIASG